MKPYVSDFLNAKNYTFARKVIKFTLKKNHFAIPVYRVFYTPVFSDEPMCFDLIKGRDLEKTQKHKH